MFTILDAIQRNQVYLEGLKAGQVNGFQATAAAMAKDVRSLLLGLDFETMDDMTKQQLNALLVELRKTITRHYSVYLTQLIKFLEAFVSVDDDMIKAIFETFADPAKIKAAKDKYPHAVALWAKSKNAPLPSNGLLMLDFVRAISTVGVIGIVNRVRQGYAAREKPSEVVNAIVGTKSSNFSDGLINKQSNGVRAVVGTAIQHIDAINHETIGAMLFGRYQWVSVIDSATTPICRFRNGKVYTYGAGSIPPAHTGCRSTAVPILDNGDPRPPPSLAVWAATQDAKLRKDMFGTETVGAHFNGSPPLTLTTYAAKKDRILSDG